MLTLLAAASAVGAAAGDGAPADPLAAGWTRSSQRARLLETLGLGQADPALRARLAGRRAADAAGALARGAASGAVAGGSAGSGPSPEAPGDRLVVSKDDGFATTPVFSHEGRLVVAEGAAGPADFLAFRFATQELAHELPIEVRGLLVGFDNRWGRTTWPLLGLAREAATAPLLPTLPAVAAVTGFSDPLTALPPPGGSGPDAFARLPVAFPTPVRVDPDLSLDDGAWSDAFDRVPDEPLDHPASDWLECTLAGCTPRALAVRSLAVTKTAAGDALGVKFPAAAVAAVRPFSDLDLALSVAYDVSAGTAGRAGLAFRIETLAEFYYVEYRKATNEVALVAQTPAGPVALCGTAPPLPPGCAASPLVGARPAGVLSVAVTGANPTTRIAVLLDGQPLFAYDDSVFRYAGALSGVLSLGASSGERWDSFTVRRNPDWFALVQLPPGEEAALPAEWSPQTVGFAHVQASRDGASWAPLAAPRSCRAGLEGLLETQPVNAFVSLEVGDASADAIDNVFHVESKLASLVLDCPACPATRNLCAEDEGPLDLQMPLLETGQGVDLNAGWWNERVPDLDASPLTLPPALRLRAEVWRVSCDATVGTLFASREVEVALDAGQASGGPAFHTLAQPLLSFTPDAAGSWCAQVIELYDGNGDGCADGFEAAPGSPCPPGCTCVPDPDQNAATGILRRKFTVELPCAPLAASELDPGSLRAARDLADPVRSRVEWATAGTLARRYNLHATRDRLELVEPAVRLVAPVVERVTGDVPVTSRSLALPPAPPAGVLYLSVFQTDGCPSAQSLP